ncbi:MAG: T9SS type A sorting domain-containing protein, partial [Schleiferiaceae bacterium]|nr:T9SS type A sorting domain-containing protein [Schleiferiaceae bacterium]
TVTITGLTAGTTYDFYVTDSCGANDLSTQTGPGTFITEACLASAQCSYTLNLYDTFGDGWNGNEVDVFQGGANSGSFGASFTGGDSLTGLSLALCPNQTIDLILNEGSFSSEIEFFVINPAGDTVASHLASSTISDGDTLASFTTAPAANAGMSGSDTVCTSAGTVDLTSYLGTYDQGGTWTDLSGSGALTDSLFDASAVGSGTYNFTYLVSSNSGCSVDSSGVTITVQSPSNAGAMAADTLCDTAMVVDLNNYLDTTADAGGSWVDVNGTGALSGSDFDPSMVTPNATYDFRYVVSAPCGADSTTVSLYVDFCSSSIEEYLNGQVNLFPNPAQDVVNIETTGTLTNMAVTVYDAQGKALIRASVPTNGTKQLEVSALPAGMYTVSIQSDQGMAVKRFVKE